MSDDAETAARLRSIVDRIVRLEEEMEAALGEYRTSPLGAAAMQRVGR